MTWLGLPPEEFQLSRRLHRLMRQFRLNQSRPPFVRLLLLDELFDRQWVCLCPAEVLPFVK